MGAPYECDRVLFVERSGELRSLARLSTAGAEPEGNQVLRGPESVGVNPKPGDVEKGGDEVWIGEKFQSNPEIAGSPRNSFRASLVQGLRR